MRGPSSLKQRRLPAQTVVQWVGEAEGEGGADGAMHGQLTSFCHVKALGCDRPKDPACWYTG